MWRCRVRASPNIIYIVNKLIYQYRKWSGWHMKESCSLSRPDDFAVGSITSGWLMANGLSHPDDLWCNPKSPGWHNEIWTLSHPDDLAIYSISPGWLIDTAVCHPENLQCCPMSSGWHNVIWAISHSVILVVSHRADLWTPQYVIRMTFDVAVCDSVDITKFES